MQQVEARAILNNIMDFEPQSIRFRDRKQSVKFYISIYSLLKYGSDIWWIENL